MSGLFRTGRQDRKVYNGESRPPVHVQDTRIHQELAQVATNIADGRGVGRTQIDQQDALAHAAPVTSGLIVVLDFRQWSATRSATLQPETIESLSEMPSR